VSQMTGLAEGASTLSVNQYTRDDIDWLFELTDAAIAGKLRKALKDTIVTDLFYEPSTRTYASFMAASFKMRGNAIPIVGVEYSSVAKGESLEDTVRTLQEYSDAIVLRHPEVGSAKRAAHVLQCPLINAGDGPGEHPTQALLDLYTIQRELGRIDDLRITLLGDLKFGRTVHSLAQILCHYNVHINYVAPRSLEMPLELKQKVAKHNITQFGTTNLHDVLSDTDVLYVTRIQKERFEDENEYEALKGSYVILPETLEEVPGQSFALMHPLPRVGEISPLVDHDPRAAYFRQAGYGMNVRMALLAILMGKVK